MSRKNAELAAVRRDAERKHGELKAAIDKLEEQLAVAVANADNVRRQSEDQVTFRRIGFFIFTMKLINNLSRNLNYKQPSLTIVLILNGLSSTM